MQSTERHSTAGQSMRKLRAVVELGMARGLWTILAAQSHNDHPDGWSLARVQTPEGLIYALSAGGWRQEVRIRMAVGWAEEGAHRVLPNDVIGYQDSVVSATASSVKTIEALLQDFQRRMLDNPKAREQATMVRDRLRERIESGNRLRAHMAGLQILGYAFPNVSDAAYSATGYYNGPGAAPRSVTVYEGGRITFEGQTQVERFAAVIAALRG